MPENLTSYLMAGNPRDATPSRNSAGQALIKGVRGIFFTVAKGVFVQRRKDAKDSSLRLCFFARKKNKSLSAADF
jgi:hypothetical protein